MLLEVCLVCIKHTIEPRKQFLRTVVGVENDGDFVQRSDTSNVVSACDGTTDRSFLVLVVNTLYNCELECLEGRVSLPFQRNMLLLPATSVG